MRVLLSAYACEPGEGSEPGVGWNTAIAVAQYHDVWVLTRSNNRTAVEAALLANPRARLRFVYYDLPAWIRFWKSGQRGVNVYYYLWQVGAFLKAKRIHRQSHFDIAHHVTLVRYWMPSFLGCLGIPLMFGPVGGAETMPAAFARELSFSARTKEALRRIVRSVAEYDPLLSIALRRTALALGTTPQTVARLRRLLHADVEVMPESGLSDDELEFLQQIERNNEPARQIRFLSVGRLLHWKGFHLGLRGFAAANVADSEYWIVGDGPERAALMELSASLGIADRVRFLGSLPRAEVFEVFAETDVLVHPSLHDSGGWVCLEGMAAAMPVICLDIGGPAAQVTKEAGFKISPSCPERVVREIANAIRRLSADQGLRSVMGAAGQRHVQEHFSWTTRTARLLALYQRLATQEAVNRELSLPTSTL